MKRSSLFAFPICLLAALVIPMAGIWAQRPVAGPGTNADRSPTNSIPSLRLQLRKYETLAADIALQLRELLKTPGTKGPRVDQAQAELRIAVTQAFAARQRLHQAELDEFQQRVLRLQEMIEARNGIQKEIIDRRIQDLLNPDLEWKTADPLISSEAKDPFADAASTKAAPTELETPKLADLSGHVTDARGDPLADAHILIILKTWPGGSYQQEDFAVTTNAQGDFRLPEQIPTSGQYAVNVTAFKAGYGFESRYELKQRGKRDPLAPLTFRLHEARPVVLIVRNKQGQPVKDVRVGPSERSLADGTTHLVYFQGSEPLWASSGADGRISLAGFAPGDRAKVYLQRPGHDREQSVFSIPDDGQVILSLPPSD